MKRYIGILLTTVMMLCFTACSNNAKLEEQLKTDILGVWCTENGPDYEYVAEKPDSSYYMFYEFCSDGQLIHHFPSKEYGSLYGKDPYTIENNMLIVDGQKCRIEIKDDILTMINDGGAVRYRRVGIEEMYEYKMIPIEPENQEKYKEYKQEVEGTGNIQTVDESGHAEIVLPPGLQGEDVERVDGTASPVGTAAPEKTSQEE